MKLLPGTGDFTCCSNNHDFGKGPVPCDKVKVLSVLNVMMNAKAKYFFDAGQTYDAQVSILANRTLFLHGLVDGGSIESCLEDFKRDYRWVDFEAEDVRNSERGGTLAHIAARANAPVALREYLSIDPASINKYDKFGYQPLHQATGLEIIEILLDARADPKTEAMGFTPVGLYAMEPRDDALLRIWLDRFPEEPNAVCRTIDGGTPLFVAVMTGQRPFNSVKTLLAARADPLFVTGTGVTPFMVAAENDADAALIELLLAATEREAVNDKAEKYSGVWPVVFFVSKVFARLGSTNGFVRWLAVCSGATALQKAACQGNLVVCQTLLEARANPLLRNDMGMAPVECATYLNGIKSTDLDALFERYSNVA